MGRSSRVQHLSFVALAVTLLASACSSPAAVTTTTITQASSATDHAYQAIIDDYVADTSGGVVALLRRNGVESILTSGVANADGDPVRPGSAFRVGSISKPFVATMIMQLVDEGRIDIDTPLGDYLPEVAIGGGVTIRSLLSHRSGIPEYTEQSGLFTDVLEDPDLHLQPVDVLGYVEGLSLAPEGLAFVYSNTNYILLGMLIEHLDRTDLSTSLERRITAPLGLTSTLFPTDAANPPEGIAGGWSLGVVAGDPAGLPEAIESGAWAAGALISTVEDLVRFIEALFDGHLVSEASLAEMFDTEDDMYGLGLMEFFLDPGAPAYGHNGAIFGFTSTMAHSPETGDTLVILTNNDRLVADHLAYLIVRDW